MFEAKCVEFGLCCNIKAGSFCELQTETVS